MWYSVVSSSVATIQSPNPEATRRPTIEQQRAELASVLRSPLFKRSPKISRLLSYLCDKHFRGETGQITEYAIAVEVLERDADFNPQVDAVVRVDPIICASASSTITPPRRWTTRWRLWSRRDITRQNS